MSEKVFPASKPSPAPPTINGTTTANPAKFRPPYRPHPYNHGRTRRHRSKRNMCCRCLFCSILLLLILLLLAAIAGAALYRLYHPHRPTFSIPSLRIHRLNLTTDSDSSTSHVTTLLNLTITSRNPNSHITYSYDAVTLTSLTSNEDVFLGNGTLPSFVSREKNETSFKNVVVSGSVDLDADAVNKLRSDMRKRNGGNQGVALKVLLDTKVVVKAGKLKSKKVGIRVTCDGIRGAVPKGKASTPTVADTSGVKCKVDLRIKIWKFTF